MRRVFGEVLLTVGAITILLIALAVADDRVREHVTHRVVAQPTAEISSVMARVRRSAETVAVIVRAESRAHTPLVVFSVAAAILVAFMLRT
jgi:hypothetical protein